MKDFFIRLEKLSRETPFFPGIISHNRTVPYRMLNRLAGRCAGWIQGKGIEPGDRVGIQVADPVSCTVVALGLLRAGATQVALPATNPVPVNRALCRDLAVKRVIGETDDGIFEVAVDLFSLNGLRDARPSDTIYDPADPDRLAMILSGSGTTGAPKRIPLTFGTLSSQFHLLRTVKKLGAGDRLATLMPVYLPSSLYQVMACLWGGGTVVFPDHPSLPLIQACNRLGVNHLYMTCIKAHQMLAKIRNRNIESPRMPMVKSFTITGAPVSQAVRQEVMTLLSPNLYVSYGSNEFGIACRATPEMSQDHPDTIGTAAPGVAIEIVDDADRVVPSGETGLVRMKTPGMFHGYLEAQPVETPRALKNGWFYPGDLACMDDSGRIRFKGRADDMMIYGGDNIYPREIEIVLERHPAVREAAAFPARLLPDTQTPAAAVVLKDTARQVTQEALVASCRRELGWKSPAYVLILDEFPRNRAGKILKNQLESYIADA